MGIYTVKDLNHRTILTVDFAGLPQRTQILSGDGTLLGYVELKLWGLVEYFNPTGALIGKVQPHFADLFYSPIHFQVNQQGIMRIINATDVHWVRDISQIGSEDYMPRVATITSGWTSEDSKLIEELTLPGQPYSYIIQGTDEQQKCIAGMAVFAFELLV